MVVIYEFLEFWIFLGVVLSGISLLFHGEARKFIGTHHNAFSIVALIFAGFYVLVAYRLDLHREQVDRTRHYIELLETGDVHNSRLWMDLFWMNNAELLNEIDDSLYGENADLGRAHDLIDEYGRKFVEYTGAPINEPGNDGTSHLMRLFYFYADIAKCVELGLCETQSACDLFDADMGNLYVLHSDFVSKWREVAFDQAFDSMWRFWNESCS